MSKKNKKMNNWIYRLSIVKNMDKIKIKTDIFVKKAKIVHGDKYEYSKVEYITNNVHVIITCPTHGDFNQTPSNHLARKGCSRCGHKGRKVGDKFTKKTFIEKSTKIHNNKYNYDYVKEGGLFDKVDILCEHHGIFSQVANDHMRGSGCIKCRDDKNRKPIQTFKQEAICMHGNIYIYDEVKYTDGNTDITVICPKHGKFITTVNKHLHGHKCEHCIVDCKTHMFLNDVNIVHSNKYKYPNFIYVNSQTKINILCPYHGEFLQTCASHISGRGCPQCKNSHGEIEIKKILEEKKIKFLSQYPYPGCKHIRQLKLDFYLEDFNLFIEFDGIQHFKAYEFFGGNEKYQKAIHRDRIKNMFCLDNYINLLRISYKDIHKADIMIETALQWIKKHKKHIFVCDNNIQKPIVIKKRNNQV